MGLVSALTTATTDLRVAVDKVQGITVKLRRYVVSRDALVSVDEAISLIGIGRAPGRALLVELGVIMPLGLKAMEPSRVHDAQRIIWGDVLDALRDRAKRLSNGESTRVRPLPRAVPRGRAW